MGYCVNCHEINITIEPDKLMELGILLSKLDQASPTGYRWVEPGFTKSMNIVEIFDEWGYEVEQDLDGTVIFCCHNSDKWGDDEKLFEAIAPAVQDGSLAHFVGEDGEHWKYVFKNGKMEKRDGAIDFSELPEDQNEQVKYLLDMTTHMPEGPEKFSRWLGFIQGAMWSLGLRKIDEMKDDNRVSVQNGLEKAIEVLRSHS